MLAVGVAPGIIAALFTELAATRFTNTISAGVILLSALAGLATIVGVIYGVRWKIAYEVERKAREGAGALNDQLEDRIRTFAHERDDLLAKLDERSKQLVEANKTIGRLEPLESVAKVLELVTTSFERLVERQEELHRENQRATGALNEGLGTIGEGLGTIGDGIRELLKRAD